MKNLVNFFILVNLVITGYRGCGLPKEKHKRIYSHLEKKFSLIGGIQAEKIEATQSPIFTPNDVYNVQFDLSEMTYTSDKDIADSKWLEDIEKTLKSDFLPKVALYFRNLLKIKRNYPTMYKGVTVDCIDVEFSEMFMNDFQGGLGLLITLEGTREDSYVAYSYPCEIDQTTNRPVFGVLNFNPYYFDIVNFRDLFDTTIHEIFHILGFNPVLYSYFVNEENEKLGRNNVVLQENGKISIKTPKVVEFAKKHFACDTLESVRLEDDGGDGSQGSHWERSLLMNESMTASEIANTRVSGFTLSLMEDTGWYTVNYKLEEFFTFKKGAGCDAVAKEDFNRCEIKGKQGCFYERDHQSVCYKDFFGGPNLQEIAIAKTYCRDKNMKKSKTFFYESYGNHSKCFIGDLKRKWGDKSIITSSGSFCFDAVCEGSQKKLYLKIGEDTYDCSKKENIEIDTEFLFGTVECPGYATVCMHYSLCSAECELTGRCLIEGNCFNF